MMEQEGTKARGHEGTKGRPRLFVFAGNQQLATSNSLRPAFTFTEVMFAVILLGIGFIMVAAIFPVAIQQSQSNLEDAAGVAVAKQGAAIMSQMGQTLRQYFAPNAASPIPNYTYFVTADVFASPASAPLHLFTDGVTPAAASPLVYNTSNGGPAFRFLKGNFIDQSDSRYAWVPVAYQCSSQAAVPQPTSAKVWVLAMKVRSQSQYTAQDYNVNIVNGNPYGTFIPRVEYFYLTDKGIGQKPNYITFVNSTTACSPSFDPPEAAEGAYVWVADDQVGVVVNNPGVAPVNPGQANGRFYRLGAKRSDLGLGWWELVPGEGPGHDMSLGSVTNSTPPPTTLEVNENLPPRSTGVAFGETPSTPPGGLPAKGFIVGRGYTTPSNPTPPFYEGTSQDLIALPPITVQFPN